MGSVPLFHLVSLALSRRRAAAHIMSSWGSVPGRDLPGAGAVPSWAATVRARRVRLTIRELCHQ